MDAIYVNWKQSHDGTEKSLLDVACNVCADLKYNVYVDWNELKGSATAGNACQSCSVVHRGLMSFEAERTRLQKSGSFIDIEVSNGGGANEEHCEDDNQQTLRVTTQHIFDFDAEASDPPVYEFFIGQGQTSPYSAIRACIDFNDSPVSARWLDTATSWIRKCVSTHSRCRGLEATEMPRRVLSIGKDIYLTDSENTKGIYVCLSYCWGQDTTGLLRTTKANLKQMQQEGIKWDTLPRTMKHAIMITRLLNVSFLWIDSLCIIQDDEEDWERESGKMASTYHNAFLTISAVSSAEPRQGIFCEADERCRDVHKIPLTTTDKNCCQVSVRRSLKHTQFRSMFATQYDDAPLLSRAWAFQEHLLSTRVLQFTSSELLWECNQLQQCECGGVKEGGEQIKQTHSICLAENSLRSLSTMWGLVVQKYTSLDLTMQKDRLPALSGIAKQISQLGTLGTYHAGLWEKDFARELLWFHPFSLVSKRPDKYRAPSWSWASTEGISHLSLHLLEDSPPFEVYDIHTESSETDPTGACNFGMCVLGGLYLQSTVTCAQEDDHLPPMQVPIKLKYKLRCGTGESWSFAPDVELADNADSATVANFKLDVKLLLVGREPSVKIELCFLVLQTANEKGTIFQRIGMTWISEREARNFVKQEDLQAGSFAII